MLVPLAISAIALFAKSGTDYVAGSDTGLIELRTDDVEHHPVLLGPFAREGWNHPGPALFYALALPYQLVGRHSIGLLLGALVLNGLAITGMAVIARRRAGVPLMIATLLGCSVLLLALGPEFLRDPWNPYVALFPFGFLVFLAWAMTTGEIWALPVAVGVASFCVQTYVGYAPVAVPLVASAIAWLVLATIRSQGEARERGDRAARSLVLASLVAVAVLVLMWLPALLQQLLNSPGNLSEVVRYFTNAKGLRHSLTEGFRIVAGQFGISPPWLTGNWDVVPFSGEPFLLGKAPVPVLLIPLCVAVAFLWRSRVWDGIRLVVVLVLTAVLGAWSVARIIGPAYEYRLRWSWFVGTLAFVIVTWAAWIAVSRLARTTGARRLLLAVPITTLAVLSGVAAVGAIRAGPPQEVLSAADSSLAPVVAASLPRGGGDVIVRSHTFEGAVHQPALVLYLERHGADARVDRSNETAYGAHRVHESGTPVRAVLTIAADEEFDKMAAQPDLHLVAYWGRRSPAHRARVLAGRDALYTAHAQGRISVDVLARQLSRLELGSAVGVFMESPSAGVRRARISAEAGPSA